MEEDQILRSQPKTGRVYFSRLFRLIGGPLNFMFLGVILIVVGLLMDGVGSKIQIPVANAFNFAAMDLTWFLGIIVIALLGFDVLFSAANSDLPRFPFSVATPFVIWAIGVLMEVLGTVMVYVGYALNAPVLYLNGFPVVDILNLLTATLQ